MYFFSKFLNLNSTFISSSFFFRKSSTLTNPLPSFLYNPKFFTSPFLQFKYLNVKLNFTSNYILHFLL